jgi:hypothetical protein
VTADTFATATKVNSVHAGIGPENQRKIAGALGFLNQYRPESTGTAPSCARPADAAHVQHDLMTGGRGVVVSCS